MKTKSLIIGVVPNKPFESQWVSIMDREEWNVVPNTHGHQVKLTDEVELEVMCTKGMTHQIPLHGPIKISGAGVRALLLKEILGVERFSIVLEEV